MLARGRAAVALRGSSALIGPRVVLRGFPAVVLLTNGPPPSALPHPCGGPVAAAPWRPQGAVHSRCMSGRKPSADFRVRLCLPGAHALPATLIGGVGGMWPANQSSGGPYPLEWPRKLEARMLDRGLRRWARRVAGLPPPPIDAASHRRRGRRFCNPPHGLRARRVGFRLAATPPTEPGNSFARGSRCSARDPPSP